MSIKLILLGLPGVGKGTQATKIITEYNILHISTGDIFRKAMTNKTTLGVKAKEYMDSGNLVPDEITNGIVEERLNESDTDNGFILDGFPRNISQAKELDKILNNKKSEIDMVLYFTAKKETLINRMIERGRNDDTIEVIKNRLEVNNDLTNKIADFYRDKNILKEIDAERSVDDIFSDVKKLLDNIN